MASSVRRLLYLNEAEKAPYVPITIRDMSTTSTIAEASQSAGTEPSLTLRPVPTHQESKYRYAHLLPHFSSNRYPPLLPFGHVDPGSRALSHDNPRAFLDNATSVRELTPYLGTEVTGVNIAELDSAGRDQLALEVYSSSQDHL